ncbi:MAG TPA: PP2C family serine/threonine-protein phosphatase [Jatrophihabitans sp.]|jgi:protein phosphatase|uniref:PP2C family protein-serine/threonine phosphatase n=1 Tax=Jatrophihabitans sp. TaxID=1932789 RepID=UPI002F1B76A7
MLTLRWGSATDVGRVRTLNEDSLLAVPGLFVVADGMGGHAAGEVASQLAVAEFARLAEQAAVRAEDVAETVRRANEHILAAGAERGDRHGMGTTLTGISVVGAGQDAQGEQLAVFNVGDSRVYQVTEGQLRQLTVDHSAVQELVDAGRLTAQAARTHPRRNVVTRSLGTDPAPDADVWLVQPVAGDRFLVCSDGLTGELQDSDIAELLGQNPDPQAAADELVRQAVAVGGHDNVTVVVLDVVEVLPDQAAQAAQTAQAAQAETAALPSAESQLPPTVTLPSAELGLPPTAPMPSPVPREVNG